MSHLCYVAVLTDPRRGAGSKRPDAARPARLPKVLMLDEPSLGLAPALIENLYSILAELRDEGVTILLVDQMAELALSVSDRAYVLDAGRFSDSGTAEQVAGTAPLADAYLGGSSEAP